VAIVSKRAGSPYRGAPSRSWLKTKNMVEGVFILLGTEIDDSGIPWALLDREQHGELEFAGPAILRFRPRRGGVGREVREMVIERPALRGAEEGL